MAAIPTLSLVLLLAVSSVSASSNTFNVVSFGARSGGKTDCKKAFLAAWDKACASPGTNTVVIPGGTFGIGTVRFNGPCKGNMVFQVIGTLRAPEDTNYISQSYWIVFYNINGLKITGKGTFDGRGESAWPHNNCRHHKCKALPTSIQLSYVNNSIVEGITSLNSKMFHFMIYKCNNIHVHHITITAPENSPNTDGIHIGLSTNVAISHSHIGTGDDCISIGATNSDISITNVYCGPGHGISVGSLGKYSDEKDVTNLYVKDCTISNTMNGVRIKTWQNSNHIQARNFTFKNINMKNVGNPIIIDQEYCPRGNCGSQHASNVKISDIHFEKIVGTSSTPIAVTLKCSKAVPCRNVELKDVHLKYAGGGIAKSLCANIHGLHQGNVFPQVRL